MGIPPPPAAAAAPVGGTPPPPVTAAAPDVNMDATSESDSCDAGSESESEFTKACETARREYPSDLNKK